MRSEPGDICTSDLGVDDRFCGRQLCASGILVWMFRGVVMAAGGAAAEGRARASPRQRASAGRAHDHSARAGPGAARGGPGAAAAAYMVMPGRCQMCRHALPAKLRAGMLHTKKPWQGSQ